MNDDRELIPVPLYRADFACPYCGRGICLHVRAFEPMQIIHCDEEAGGCGEPFAVRIVVRFTVAAEVYRIEQHGAAHDEEAAR